jgi:hypothetical protein
LTPVLGRGVSHLAGYRFMSWNQFISQSAWNPRRDRCQKLARRDRFTLYPRRPKVPSFIVDGELFWGREQLVQARLNTMVSVNLLRRLGRYSGKISTAGSRQNGSRGAVVLTMSTLWPMLICRSAGAPLRRPATGTS